jgi:CDP-glycerol glycerophosphotransferase (TagB/SpsB family)
MHRLVLMLMAGLVASPALAQSKEPIALRDMGSFHIGGRQIEVSGQPIKEVLFTSRSRRHGPTR